VCRIVFKRDNSVLFDKNELMESYRTNPDGTGFIYYDEAQDLMVVQK
jgi:hypothetical protein